MKFMSLAALVQEGIKGALLKHSERPGHVTDDDTMVTMLWKVLQINIYTHANL